MKPYYDHNGITIYCGDCREVLLDMDTDSIDAVVTDPPYGIGFEYESHDDTLAGWYDLMNSVVPECRRIAGFVVMPSCQIKRLPWWYDNHQPDWLICWHKGSPGHNAVVGFNDWEPHVSWGRPTVPMHDHFQTRCGFADYSHPCPKPIEWGMWLVKRASQHTILDPFAGSGTTLVAAKLQGRKAIGIEIEEKYCEIAAKRLAQEVFDFEN